MPSKLPRIAWVAIPIALFVYLYRLDGAGLIGKDEPRYASIARDMARTGDWVTPRLWGTPWFEKPVLLYWVAGAGYQLGLGPEWAPRLLIVLTSLAFLGFYWWILNREFGCRAATMACLILGTAAAWVGYSQVAVPDVLLSATFSAAMLLALPWISRGDQALLPFAAGLLGLAVLAKGPIALVFAAPVLLRYRSFLDLLRPRVWIPFLMIAAPWYVLCYLRNGRVFFDEFIIKHNLQRAVSTAEMPQGGHGQPWWYYLPVFAALLLPWTPLLALLFRRAMYREPRRRFLLAVVVFGFVFLSAVVNKLPGYVLPLAPALAALMAVALEERSNPRPWLVACGILLVVYAALPPIAAAAVADGVTHVDFPAFQWTWLLPAIPAGAAFWLDARKRRVAAVFSVALGAAAGIVYLKSTTMGELDRQATGRALWLEIRPNAASTCIDNVGDAWRFGLNYYSEMRLPDCAAGARPLRVVQAPGERPRIVQASASAGQ